jgi:hypothetical protein
MQHRPKNFSWEILALVTEKPSVGFFRNFLRICSQTPTPIFVGRDFCKENSGSAGGIPFATLYA